MTPEPALRHSREIIMAYSRCPGCTHAINSHKADGCERGSLTDRPCHCLLTTNNIEYIFAGWRAALTNISM